MFSNFLHKKISLIIIIIIIITGLSIGVYFISSNSYKTEYFLELSGDHDLIISKDSPYQEPGYKAYDNHGNDYSKEVTIYGEVNSNIAGEYLIKYYFKDLKKERKVTVVSQNNNLTFLILQGEKVIYLQKGESYQEPGYTVIDMVDSNLKDKVIITGQVDPNNSGTYKLTYSVTNSENQTISEERTIIVIGLNYSLSLENKDKYTKSNNIIFNTTDANYQYVLLPDNSKETSKNISYKVTTNGKYTFKIYNTFGSYEEQTITINNLDTQSPTGSCTGYMYNNYTELTTNAQDDLGIVSYEYLYGNNTSGKLTTNKYKYTSNIDNAKVIIYDKVNNQKTINCQMIDKSTSIPTSYKSYNYKDPNTSRTMNYWLYIPDNLTARHSVPLLVYMHGDGGRGTNLKDVNLYSFPNFVATGEKYPFMMLAPQIGKDTNWTDEGTYKTLMNLINKLTTEYNVNRKKIILAGGSSGGGGVYVITAAYPNFFSCSVVGSGIYDSKYRKIANNLTTTPMWIFHGTNDSNIDFSSVKSFSEYIKSLGGNVTFVGVEGGTHGVTETTQGFRNPSLINWIISQERK